MGLKERHAQRRAFQQATTVRDAVGAAQDFMPTDLYTGKTMQSVKRVIARNMGECRILAGQERDVRQALDRLAQALRDAEGQDAKFHQGDFIA